MDSFLSEMIKQQNQFLLARIARDFKKDENKLIKMYLTPSFYKVTFDSTNYQLISK